MRRPDLSSEVEISQMAAESYNWGRGWPGPGAAEDVLLSPGDCCHELCQDSRNSLALSQSPGHWTHLETGH